MKPFNLTEFIINFPPTGWNIKVRLIFYDSFAENSQFSEGGEGWTDLMKKLHSNRDHKLAPIDTNDFETSPVIQSIYIQDDGIIQAVSDYRHGGIPDGH